LNAVDRLLTPSWARCTSPELRDYAPKKHPDKPGVFAADFNQAVFFFGFFFLAFIGLVPAATFGDAVAAATGLMLLVAAGAATVAVGALVGATGAGEPAAMLFIDTAATKIAAINLFMALSF
jgi:hypothetical protein